jgi:hypothetical protein
VARLISTLIHHLVAHVFADLNNTTNDIGWNAQKIFCVHTTKPSDVVQKFLQTQDITALILVDLTPAHLAQLLESGRSSRFSVRCSIIASYLQRCRTAFERIP